MPLKIVDSHCHLDCLDLKNTDLDQVIDKARHNDICHLLNVCTQMETFSRTLSIAQQYQGVTASLGMHPSETGQEPTVEDLLRLSADPKVVAIGETGLDYHYEHVDPKTQRLRFKNHILAARQAQLPLIIHTRDAREDTIDLLTEHRADEVGGVLHCFTESQEMAEAGMDLGFYVSFSGIVTFKNAQTLKEVAQKIPLDRLLVETDSPYLTPVPLRGKPNYPSYVRHVAEYVANLRGITLEALAEATTANFARLFKVDLKHNHL